MNTSIVKGLLLTYLICSGGVVITGMTLVAKLLLFPKDKGRRASIKLISLGHDGAGIRSDRHP